MATPHSPLRVSYNLSFNPFQHKSGDRQFSYSVKENFSRFGGHEDRSRSPNQYAGGQTRQYQYQSRYGINQGAGHSSSVLQNSRVQNMEESRVHSTSQTRKVTTTTTVIKRVSQHQEFFISELQSEVAEMKSRQRDIGALKDQYRYL